MAASDKLDELTNVMNLLASEVMNLRRLLAGQATPPPGQAAPGQAAAGGAGAGGAGGAGSPAQQQGGSGGGQPWQPPFGPPDPTFPTPGAFSRPMSQEALVSLQGRYQRQGETESTDLYGATANLLGTAGPMIPGAGSLAVGMNRLRGLSEAYDHFRRTMWARQQQAKQGLAPTSPSQLSAAALAKARNLSGAPKPPPGWQYPRPSWAGGSKPTPLPPAPPPAPKGMRRPPIPVQAPGVPRLPLGTLGRKTQMPGKMPTVFLGGGGDDDAGHAPRHQMGRARP